MSVLDKIKLDIQSRQAECQAHGAFTSRNIFGNCWTKCPTCAEEAEAAAEAERERREKAEAAERWQKRLGHSGIPERFHNRTLKSYVAECDGQARALAFAQHYSDGFKDALETGSGALFIGLPGTGKTHLACGIGLRIMHRYGCTVLFTTVLRAIRRIKDTWAKGSKETESEAIATLTFPDLLILDEVGVQFGSDTEKLMLFDVLNDRYERRRPTLLLSNLTLAEVSGYLGERIMDRMREDGGEVVVFDWASHRGKVKT